jgi:hypothetical protein
MLFFLKKKTQIYIYIFIYSQKYNPYASEVIKNEYFFPYFSNVPNNEENKIFFMCFTVERERKGCVMGLNNNGGNEESIRSSICGRLERRFVFTNVADSFAFLWW